MSKRGTVVVYGRNITRPPLLDSDEPQFVLFKDAFGDPMALFVRILSEDTWGLVTRGDPDWNAMLVKYGFTKLPEDADPRELIEHGVDAVLGVSDADKY